MAQETFQKYQHHHRVEISLPISGDKEDSAKRSLGAAHALRHDGPRPTDVPDLNSEMS